MTSTSTSIDLRPLYDTVLAPRLAALEHDRLALKHALFASLLLVGVPLLMAFWGTDNIVAWFLPAAAGPVMTAISVVLVIVGAVIAVTRYGIPGVTAYLNYRTRFKRDIVEEIFRAVSPGATYAPNNHITAEVFDSSGIFATAGEVGGDDLVRGRIGDTPFEACEIDRHYSTEGKNSHTVSVFHGLFFRFDFNKTVHGHTVVQPQGAADIRLASRRGLSRVALENPSFESAFEVYSSNPVEARYILTPLLMERILEIHQSTSRPLCLAFVDNKAFVAITFGRSLFEPSIQETTSFAALAEMAEHFGLAELVVRELDLNTRIWTKDVDARLLSEASATNPIASLATSGDLTAAGLMKQVTGQLFSDTDAGPAPERPRRTRVRIDTLAEATVIRYRLAWSTYLGMAMSFLLAAGAAIAVAMVIDPVWTLERLFPILGVPADGADIFRTGAPIAIGVCGLVGGFFALYWITYVRRVVIGRDAIRVTRGLNPFARTYPRTDQTRILQMDRYLFIGNADAVKLINPSISPVLRSGDEARWVASEMRKALAVTDASRTLG